MILCGGKGWGGVDLAKDKPRLSSQGQTKVLTQRENPGASRTLHFSPDNMALPRAGSTPWPPEGLSTSAPARRPSSCRHARGIRISGKTQPGRALPVSARVTSSGVSSSLSYKGIAVVKMLFNCGSGGREEKPGGKGRQWVSFWPVWNFFGLNFVVVLIGFPRFHFWGWFVDHLRGVDT